MVHRANGDKWIQLDKVVWRGRRIRVGYTESLGLTFLWTGAKNVLLPPH